MRRFRLRVGSLAGIPLWIHVSWFAVLGLVVWSVTEEFGAALPELPLTERLAMASVTGIAFFACLAVHEVAHAVVARRFSVRVRGITLFLLGGVAEIEGELPTPGSEFAVALAGPATSRRARQRVRLGFAVGAPARLDRPGGCAVHALGGEPGRGGLQPDPGAAPRRGEDPAGGHLAPDGQLRPGHQGRGDRRSSGGRRRSSRSASGSAWRATRWRSGTCRWGSSSGSWRARPAGRRRRSRAVR